jgi:predicted HicB family RNase H-like nuclease
MLTETQDKYQEVFQAAEGRYRQSPDWVTFFREVLGVDGLVRRTFPKFDDLTAFEQSEQYEKIQKLLVKLREKRPSADAETEPTRVITVRLPKSMHESLRTEAHDLRTSMNKLCISKLLQVIDEEMIPSERAAGGPAPSGNASPAPAPQSATTLAARPQQSPATVPYSQPHHATPPFKSAQSRF